MTYVSDLQCVAGTHPAIPGHFPNSPIVPGAWMLTLVESFCRAHVCANAVAEDVEFVRFRQPLRPDQLFRIHVTVEADERIRFEIVSDGALIADGRLRLRVAG